MKRLAAVPVLIAALLAPTAGSAASPQPLVSNCGNLGSARPTGLMIACGDGAEYAGSMRWSSWGRSAATATGTLHINQCEPDCASGHFTTQRATFKLSGRVVCSGRSHRYYRNLTVTRADGHREHWIAGCPNRR